MRFTFQVFKVSGDEVGTVSFDCKKSILNKVKEKLIQVFEEKSEEKICIKEINASSEINFYLSSLHD